MSSPRSVVSQPTRTRTHWRRALILAASVLWCAFLGAPRLEAASTIGTVTASPTEIAAGTRTVVTVTTGIVDASVIPGSIRLLETDARGKALKLLGFLRDDGTAGDQTAGDRIYTMRLVVREPRATQRFLRVVATFRNEPARVGSALIRLIIQRRTVPRKLEPNPLTMAVGAVGTLTATLAPPPLTPGTLVISSRNPRIASVPAGVAFAAGQTKVQIPISALSRGTATIVASLSGRRATATVRVRTGALRVIELAPPAIALTTGATGELTVRLSAVAPVDTVVNMSSSNPAVAAVPATATVPAGRMDSTVRVEGVTPGVAQIRARLNGSSAASQVTVTPAPPSVVSLLPPVSNLTVGASGTLQVTISSAQVEPTVVSITTTPPGIVSAPASVTIPPGQVTASLSVDAIALGQAGVTARLGDSSAAALVNVTEPPVAITALQPESVSLIVGATIPFTVQINTARSDETDIDLVSSVPGVLDVPDSVTIEAGQTSATFVATALAAGDAALTASVDGSSRQSAVRVAPQPAAVVSLVPSPLPLQEGATGLLRLTINAAQENDTVVALTNSAPAVAQVPAAVTVPSGALSVDVPVTGLTAGQSSVTASVNGTAVSASIVVSAPPPVVTALSPTTQQLPQGVAGTLRVTLSRGSTEPARVALSSSDGGVATVPVEVTVPAGSLFADFPVATVGVGNTTITASLNSATVLAQVTVTAAEPVSLAISPVTPSVSVGATVAFTATATLTDGTSANLTASSLWSSSTPTVASIDAAGTATALTPGETTVEARHTFTPVQTGQPVTLLAETLLSVTSPATLSLSADATEVALGESLLITLNATDVAPEGGLLVTLAASGTGAATLPTNVTIAAGDSSATFSLTGTAAGDVTVSASASGYVSASLPIAVRAPLRIDALEPTSGPVGASVAMIGGGFDTALAGNVVDFPTADTARVPGTVLSATATRLVVRVPPTAESGPIRIANARGTASSPAFSVTREQDFQVVVSPGTVTVYQGATGLTQVQLSSTGTAPFTALVRLSAEGLPAGVSARFIPAAAITGNQTVAMELVAPAGTPAGLANVRVRGELVESGQTLVRRGELDLLVQSAAGVTGAKGRFVTPARIGIAGVIVRVDTPSGPIQTTSDAAGSFQIVGIPAGEISLRFDATPANPFYPIWPYTVTLPVNQVTVFPDWTINPPPPNERFTPIANATQDQVITDPRFPGLAIRLPAGVTITGWDGVLKTRIAVERVEISKLPVPPPPTPTGSAYQLYFGTPMGGIPSAPIPVTLPNDVGGEPGEAIDVWYFDGSPMARSGEWRIAGTAIVSADGRSATMLPGTGVPRFCGVCGLVCLGKQPEGPHPFCPATAGNAIEPFTGQALPSTGGLTCGGLTPIETGMNYNPVDAYGNIGGTSASLGFGWTLDYDVGFLPFVGPQKRLLLPGNRRVNVIDDGTGNYRPFDDPRLDGAVIRATNLAANEWELTFRDQTRWRFRPFSTIFVRGGPPTFLTEIVDPQGYVVPMQ
ncbi:MAG: Ig-like domain-containing protein, partial [Vicinamibacterales bacterium]